MAILSKLLQKYRHARTIIQLADAYFVLCWQHYTETASY